MNTPGVSRFGGAGQWKKSMQSGDGLIFLGFIPPSHARVCQTTTSMRFCMCTLEIQTKALDYQSKSKSERTALQDPHCSAVADSAPAHSETDSVCVCV